MLLTYTLWYVILFVSLLFSHWLKQIIDLEHANTKMKFSYHALLEILKLFWRESFDKLNISYGRGRQG